MNRTSILVCRLAAATLAALPATGTAAALQFVAAGGDPAAIQGTVDAFRAALGANNGIGNSFASGRREINWDGVPLAFRDPLPPNFFNSNSPRGAVFATPGERFVVSGDPGTPGFLFEDLTPYSSSDNFQFFSAPRLFAAVGSTVTDVQFFIPGTTTPASVRGFGAVFTDVELADSASIQFFDPQGAALTQLFAPSGANRGLSFAGVLFDAGERVARVRITAGIGSFTTVDCRDCVVMDDFIYGEPQALRQDVPEPGLAALLGLGLLGLRAVRRRR